MSRVRKHRNRNFTARLFYVCVFDYHFCQTWCDPEALFHANLNSFQTNISLQWFPPNCTHLEMTSYSPLVSTGFTSWPQDQVYLHLPTMVLPACLPQVPHDGTMVCSGSYMSYTHGHQEQRKEQFLVLIDSTIILFHYNVAPTLILSPVVPPV